MDKNGNKKKIKRVLMFHGIDICYNTLNIFTDSLARSLKKLGVDVGYINLNCKGKALADEYVREMNKGFDAVISFNSTGQHKTYMGNDNVFEYMKVPFFDWIVDHPSEHLDNIITATKDFHIICIDRDHARYIKKYHTNISGVHFIPLGGQYIEDISNNSFEAFENRKYDVIFTGSYQSLESFANSMKEQYTNVHHIYYDFIELMIDNRSMSVEEAFKHSLRANKVELSDEDFTEYMYIAKNAVYFVRYYIREEIMRYLAENGIRIDLFGSGWDKLGDLGNIRVHAPVSYEESVRLCNESKISFNIMPLFKDGLHDRIPTAMLGGAAVMTDSNRYIDEIFATGGDDKEILIYDVSHPETIADEITRALSDVSSLYKIARRGNTKAKASFTWDERAKEVLKLIEQDDYYG